MSDYPRSAPLLPPKPHRIDRYAAFVIGALALFSNGRSILYAFHRRPTARHTESWRVYLTIEAVQLAIEIWILWGVVRSRFWGVVALAIYVGLDFVLAELQAHVSVPVITELVIVLFALARLFAVVGPRLIRRRDVWAEVPFPEGQRTRSRIHGE